MTMVIILLVRVGTEKSIYLFWEDVLKPSYFANGLIQYPGLDNNASVHCLP